MNRCKMGMVILLLTLGSGCGKNETRSIYQEEEMAKYRTSPDAMRAASANQSTMKVDTEAIANSASEAAE